MKNLLFLGLLFVSFATTAQSLKEKQAIASLDFTWAERSIKDNYGSAVKIELDQPSFAGDIDAIQYADSRGAVMTANAIAKVCGYAVGKEALTAKKVNKIILRNIKEGKYKVEIKSGVLTVFNGFSSSGNYFGESELKEAIENLL